MTTCDIDGAVGVLLRCEIAPMKKKAAIRIYYWRTKRKGTDVWKVAIDDIGGGPLTELKTRYTRPTTARRGGLRKVGAEEMFMGFDFKNKPTWMWMVDGRAVNILKGKPE